MGKKLVVLPGDQVDNQQSYPLITAIVCTSLVPLGNQANINMQLTFMPPDS